MSGQANSKAGSRSAHGSRNGAVAQLGERLTGSQEVDGSIPFSSTKLVQAPQVEHERVR